MMKKQPSVAWIRIGALLVATVLILVTGVLPVLAVGMGGRGGRDKGILGRTGDAIESGAEKVESGAESIVDDLTDIPNGTDQNDTADGNDQGVPDGTDQGGADTNGGDMNGDGANGGTATDTNIADTDRNDGLMGDEVPEDGTNIPDTDIGGAVEDNDHDGVSDPTDPDDDNDGVRDPVDTDADGDGVEDSDETTGVIGIVIAVIVVIAIIILVVAVIPRARKH